MSGTLFVVATPIGNLGDLSPRARETLAGADYVLVEDTRVSARLFAAFDLHPRLRVYEKHRERRETDRILADLQAGSRIALISDAGTPGIADPGAPLVSAALDAGIAVVPVPGPSALAAAVSVSGVAELPIIFHGYPPDKAGLRRELLAGWQGEPGAHVLLVPPHDVLAVLGLLAEILPGRRVVLCRELTKMHESVLAGPAAAVAEQLTGGDAVRGEMTLVVHPAADEDAAGEIGDLVAEARRLRDATGLDGKDLSDFLAFRAGVPRRTAYRAVLALRE